MDGGLEAHGVIVDRVQLLDRLDAVSIGTTVMISAGPGYGKSTLLAQWMRRQHGPCLMISVDTDMDSVAVLGRHLAGGLLSALPDVAAVIELHDRATSSAPDWPRVLFPRLLDILGEHGVTIMLDDVHIITDGDLRALLRQLVRGVPSPSRVVLAGRQLENLGVARLQSQGRVVTIGEDALAFNTADIRCVLGAEFDTDSADAIHERTGGWPAGVMLAATSEKARDVEARLLTVHPWTLSHFLEEEVFADIPAAQMQFVEELASIAPISSGLCDRILGRSDSEMLLRELSCGVLPMLSISPPPITVSMHGLLRDELLSRLSARDGALPTTLRLAAAATFESIGLLDEAFGYFMLAGDVDRIDGFLYRWGVDTILGGQKARAQRWLDAAEHLGGPHRPVRVLGRLSISGAEGDTFSLMTEREHLASLGSASLPGGLTAAEAARRIGVIFGVVPFEESATGAQTAEVEAWECLEGMVRAFNDLLHDRTDSAESISLALGPAISRWPLFDSGRLTTLALIAGSRQRWIVGSEYLEQALAICGDHRFDDDPLTFYQDGVAAKFAMRDGDQSTARQLAARAMSKLGRLAKGGPIGRRFVTLIEVASVYAMTGDRPTAAMLLRECDQLAKWWPSAGYVERQLRDGWAMTRAGADLRSRPEPLSVAELRVLQFLPSHYTLPQIAALCSVAPSTIRSQTHAVYRKLGVRSRADAVTAARLNGILDI